MSELAWDPIIQTPVHDRSRKPREVGVTMIIDTGVGVSMLYDLLELTGHMVDHWKFSFGTSVFLSSERLRKKLDILAEHNVLTFPGGTLLEVALVEHHCRVYMKHAKKLGFSAVEISDGTIPIPGFRRRRIIECALDAGLVAITEVGKKDPKRQPTAEQIAEQALEDLENGASWVVIEGRESGRAVGIFDENGKVKEAVVEEINRIMGPKIEKLVWEAPLKEQQSFLIGKFGTNVGLGNIDPQQVLALESLRCRLRFETLHHVTDELLRTRSWDPLQVEPETDRGTEDSISIHEKRN